MYGIQMNSVFGWLLYIFESPFIYNLKPNLSQTIISSSTSFSSEESPLPVSPATPKVTKKCTRSSWAGLKEPKIEPGNLNIPTQSNDKLSLAEPEQVIEEEEQPNQVCRNLQ